MNEGNEKIPKLVQGNLTGTRKRGQRFAQIEYANDIRGTLKRLLSYFARERAVVFAMIGVVVFGTVCGIYAPSLQSQAVDIIAKEKHGNLGSSLIAMIFVYLCYSVSGLFQRLLSARLGQSVVKQMREELFGKFVDLPIRYMDTHSHGDVMSRMTNDIENISTTVSQSLPSFCSGVLTIVGTMIVMIWYCWQLALLSLITVVLTLIATKILSGQVRKFSRKRQMLLGQLNGTVEEMVSGYATIIAYNRQKITTEEFCETANALTKAGIRTDIFSGVMGPIMNAIGNTDL